MVIDRFTLDGASDDEYATAAAAIRDAGVDVFAVGVGNSKKEELLEITGNADRVWKARRFTAIDKFRQKMVKEVCESTSATCTDQEVDLVFMIDSSTSINDNYRKMAREVNSFIHAIPQTLCSKVARLNLAQFRNWPACHTSRPDSVQLKGPDRVRL